MEFDNSFDVPLAPAHTWAILTDINRLAPCMPGAELGEPIGPQNFRGRISVRLGPVALTFAGHVAFDSIDEVNHSARVRAQGDDAKGRGCVNALATFRIEPVAEGSRVMIHTDLMLSGAVAQYGRGVGMIRATAVQIVGQFAANLRAKLAQEPNDVMPAVRSEMSEMPSVAPPATESNSGLSLMARAVRRGIGSLLPGR